MKNYKTVLFDIDDTLIDFAACAKVSLKNCYELFFKFAMSEETFLSDYDRINQALWRQVEKGEVCPSQLGSTRFIELANLHKIDFLSEVPHYYENQLVENTRWIDGAESLLDYLKSIGVKIGFVTNGFAHMQWSKYKNLKLSRYSDVLVISEEIGCSKPESKIFHHALDRLEANISQTLMVGDSLISDGEGARRLKMPFCWFNPQRVVNPMDWDPDHVVHTLEELIFAFQK